MSRLSRIGELKEALRDACLEGQGRMVSSGLGLKSFEREEDGQLFLEGLASLLYDYESIMDAEVIREEAEEELKREKEKRRVELDRLARYLKSKFCSSKESKQAVTEAFAKIRKDQKDYPIDSIEEDIASHEAMRTRNILLLNAQTLYKNLAPLKSNRQIAFNLSLALARLGLKPDKADAIEKVFVKANKTPPQDPTPTEQS